MKEYLVLYGNQRLSTLVHAGLPLGQAIHVHSLARNSFNISVLYVLYIESRNLK